MVNFELYYCEKCDYLVEVLSSNGGVELQCCNTTMKKLEPNTVEAAVEKHLPVAKIENGILDITVGEVLHPMLEEHYIRAIFAVSKEDGTVYRKDLSCNDVPNVQFEVGNNNKFDIYAYCNLHGLWKTSI